MTRPGDGVYPIRIGIEGGIVGRRNVVVGILFREKGGELLGVGHFYLIDQSLEAIVGIEVDKALSCLGPFCRDGDDACSAFNTKDGSKKWEFATGDAVFSSPVITNDTLLIGSNDTKLYALDLATGQEKWEFATDDIIGSSPAVAGNRVYLTSFDGRLYAFGN